MRYLLYRQALWGGVRLIGKIMASLRKRRDKYYARVRKWDGVKQVEKLIPLKTSNRIEALERLLQVNRLEEDIKDGIDFSFAWMNENQKMEVIRFTLGKAVDGYLKARKAEKLRIGTLDIYERALINFINVCGNNLPIDNISTHHIELYKRQFQSNSNEYANINLRAIKTFLNWLLDNEIVSSIPKVKMVKINKKLPSYFTEKEWKNIIQLKLSDVKNKLGQLKYPEIEHYKRAWNLYYKTGCRLSEPFNGVLNGNWLTIDVDSSKTNIQREIYISNDLIQILDEMQKRLELHLANNHASKTDFIKRYSRVFKLCCKLVGIAGKHFHHIRHTFAVRRYLEVRDIYQVAKELGHSSVTTTEIYAKFNLSRLEQDFPSFATTYKKDVFGAKYVIRDTLFRDTLHLNNGIARG